MTWTDPRATPIDLAAIEACREGRWRTAAEVRDCIESGRACNSHPDTPHRVYSAKPRKTQEDPGRPRKSEGGDS